MKKFLTVLAILMFVMSSVVSAEENLGFPKGDGQGDVGKYGRAWGTVWAKKVAFGFTTYAYSSATGATYSVANSGISTAIYKITGGSGSTTLVMSYTGTADSNLGKVFYIINASSNTVTFKQSGATGINIATTKIATVVGNGTDFERITADQAQ